MLNRYIDSEGRLVTKRLHVITQNLPYFMCRLFGNITTYGGEETIIDPKKKILSIRSKNLSFTRQATALDTSSYTVCPTDSSKTLYEKSTTTYGSTASLLNNQIEKWYAYNEGHHFKKGVDVINSILSGATVIDYGVDEAKATQWWLYFNCHLYGACLLVSEAQPNVWVTLTIPKRTIRGFFGY